MIRNLLIFPFNGNGLEALACIPADYSLLGFIDDTPEKQGRHTSGFEIYSRQHIASFPGAYMLAVPGNSVNYPQRDQVIDSLQIPSGSYATLVSPHAHVSPLAKIGHNVLIMSGVVITANAIIGNHVVILPNTVVHHDVTVGDYTLIGSGVCIAGYTMVGRKCYLGSGSNIMNNITLGEGTLVGIGSTIIRDTKAGSRVVGNPGRII